MIQNKCGQFKIKKKFHIPRWTSEIFQMWLFWGKLATSMNLTHWYHSGRDMSVRDVYLNHWFMSQHHLSQFASPCLWEKLSWETLCSASDLSLQYKTELLCRTKPGSNWQHKTPFKSKIITRLNCLIDSYFFSKMPHYDYLRSPAWDLNFYNFFSFLTSIMSQNY